jgi:hypothetical protein
MDRRLFLSLLLSAEFWFLYGQAVTFSALYSFAPGFYPHEWNMEPFFQIGQILLISAYQLAYIGVFMFDSIVIWGRKTKIGLLLFVMVTWISYRVNLESGNPIFDSEICIPGYTGCVSRLVVLKSTSFSVICFLIRYIFHQVAYPDYLVLIFQPLKVHKIHPLSDDHDLSVSATIMPLDNSSKDVMIFVERDKSYESFASEQGFEFEPAVLPRSWSRC